LGLWNSQTVLLALIKKGLTREAAYELVQRKRHAHVAGQKTPAAPTPIFSANCKAIRKSGNISQLSLALLDKCCGGPYRSSSVLDMLVDESLSLGV